MEPLNKRKLVSCIRMIMKSKLSKFDLEEVMNLINIYPVLDYGE
jgi:hypothetical protein